MPSTTSASPCFDIIEDEWIDVTHCDSETTTVSLIALLSNCQRIKGVSEPSPLTEVALLRFLIALISDGLRNQIKTEDEWEDFAERSRAGFSNETVEQILTPLRGRSDVLSEDHTGFFDAPLLSNISGWDDPNVSQPVSRLLPELPCGTNIAHFVHTSDDAAALCTACLLKGRFVESAFARGGRGPSLSFNLLATINRTEPRYVLISGPTLLETFLLNLVVGDCSRPSWIAIHRPEFGNPGAIARMSWRPRLLMILPGSETTVACMRCASQSRPRYKQAVMVDTYNIGNSTFGSKSDVEGWKAAGSDPHVLPFDKESVTFGVNPVEWPLRAITRIMQGNSLTPPMRAMNRAARTACEIDIHVTSSAGNQAKIDDAPQRNCHVPLTFLKRVETSQTIIGSALSVIFDKANVNARSRLIPGRTQHLLDALGENGEAAMIVNCWLTSTTVIRGHDDAAKALKAAATEPDIEDERHQLRASARRLIRHLGSLSDFELKLLRPVGRGGTDSDAARQAVFEKIWFRAGLPSAGRRRAVRHAFGAIAGIYALYRDRHTWSDADDSFDLLLSRAITRSRTSERPKYLTRLVSDIVESAVPGRHELLRQLVAAVIKDSSNPLTCRIDFAALLVAVVDWDSSFVPTPVRWKRLLDVGLNTIEPK